MSEVSYCLSGDSEVWCGHRWGEGDHTLPCRSVGSRRRSLPTSLALDCRHAPLLEKLVRAQQPQTNATEPCNKQDTRETSNKQARASNKSESATTRAKKTDEKEDMKKRRVAVLLGRSSGRDPGSGKFCFFCLSRNPPAHCLE